MTISKEKIALYVALILVMTGLGLLLNMVISQSSANYSNGLAMSAKLLENSLSQSSPEMYRPDIPLLYQLQMSRSFDHAVIKYGAVYLGYLIVIIGAVFVLYGAQSFYKLKMEGKDVKSSLETSSPGLVMITLGAALIAIALLNKSVVDTQVSWSAGAQILAPPITSQAGNRETGDEPFEFTQAP